VFLPGSPYRMVPAPPAMMVAASPGGLWPATVWYVAGYVWIVVMVALVLGYYRTARVLALLAILPSLVWLLAGQFSGRLLTPFGSWAFWFLIDLAPVLAMAAFHRDAPPVSRLARRSWLLAVPAYCLVVSVPLRAAAATGHDAWVPDTPGVLCILVALLCLAHLPRAWSSRAGTGVWSLSLVLLAGVTGVYRIISLGDYMRDPRLIYYLEGPHLIKVGIAELFILAAAAVLVAPDAARAQTAVPSPPATERSARWRATPTAASPPPRPRAGWPARPTGGSETAPSSARAYTPATMSLQSRVPDTARPSSVAS